MINVQDQAGGRGANQAGSGGCFDDGGRRNGIHLK
jgi:hypothetical protein